MSVRPAGQVRDRAEPGRRGGAGGRDRAGDRASPRPGRPAPGLRPGALGPGRGDRVRRPRSSGHPPGRRCLGPPTVRAARPVIDALIAATARAHSMTVVTRNVKDFELAGVQVLNLFAAAPDRPAGICLGRLPHIAGAGRWPSPDPACAIRRGLLPVPGRERAGARRPGDPILRWPRRCRADAAGKCRTGQRRAGPGSHRNRSARAVSARPGSAGPGPARPARSGAR
jgi:hypothetical protein